MDLGAIEQIANKERGALKEATQVPHGNRYAEPRIWISAAGRDFAKRNASLAVKNSWLVGSDARRFRDAVSG